MNKRIEWLMQTPISSELHEHLSQLEALYTRKPLELFGPTLETSLGPKAGFYRFLDRMIAKKQVIIEKLLASIMASATPFCFCTTQKHLSVKIVIISMA